MQQNIFHQAKKNQYSIGFYNLENLFDTVNNPHTNDDEYTPKGKKNWNKKRYQQKVQQIARVIRKLGFTNLDQGPAIIGLAEVENKTVLEDLIQSPSLRDLNYDFVHYDSPDERGIDVALLYKKEVFTVTHSEAIPIYLTDEDGQRDYTRDILKVQGTLAGKSISILVNHWPSRREKTAYNVLKRKHAATQCKAIITQLQEENPDAKIVTLGDFNDDPTSPSVANHLVGDDLYNPTKQLLTRYRGTLSYRRRWNLFDQIIVTPNFLRFQKDELVYQRAGIFDPNFLKVHKGRLEGTPYRTYLGNRYQGGYSDHFPVYIVLKVS